MGTTTNTTPSTTDQGAIARAAGAVGRWDLDVDHSAIAFAVKNFWGLMTVKGGFEHASGQVVVADDGGITATLEIDAASVATGQDKRDEHLRSKDFFDVEQFPVLRVEVDRVDLRSPTAGRAHGRITILGQTRPVELDVAVELAPGSPAATVTGSVMVDRNAFGMAWRPMKMAAYDVAVDVTLRYVPVG